MSRQLTTGILGRKGIDIDLKVYLGSLTTALSSGQVALLDTFVKDLKSGLEITNLSDVFDVMYILANETSESGLNNLVKRSHDATLSATAPTFTVLEGFTGNGSSAFMELNYNARTEGVNYELNSSSYGIYFRSKDRGINKYNGVYSTTADGGTSNCIMIGSNGPTSINLTINSELLGITNSAFVSGMAMVIRNASANYDYYINKTKTNSVLSSTKIPNQGIVSLARRTTNGTVGLFNEDQQSFIFAGKGFTESEQNIIYDAFQAYMTANGKQV